jgi:hypothetical protein
MRMLIKRSSYKPSLVPSEDAEDKEATEDSVVTMKRKHGDE